MAFHFYTNKFRSYDIYFSNSSATATSKYHIDISILCRVLYPSTNDPSRTGSLQVSMATVKRCDCASTRALSTKIRASALSPAKARHTCESRRPILEGVMRVSCSFMADLLSQPNTTISLPFTPTAQVPDETQDTAVYNTEMFEYLF